MADTRGTQQSSRSSQGTYRSSPEQDLRRLPGPHALEQLVDYVLGHLDLHGLDGQVFGVPRPDVAIRSAMEGNAPGGQKSGGHGVVSSESVLERVGRCWASHQEAVKGNDA